MRNGPMWIVMWLVVGLSASASGEQVSGGFSGTWRAVAGGGGDAVVSPLRAERQARTRPTGEPRELVMEDRGAAVDLEERSPRATARLSLPLSGEVITTRDREGTLLVAQAVRDGEALIVRREHRVRLPGGGDVVVQVEDRHQLLADGTLRVETRATTGARTQTRAVIYRRVP